MRRYNINDHCTMVEIDATEWFLLKLVGVVCVIGTVIGVLLAMAYPSFADVQWIPAPWW